MRNFCIVVSVLLSIISLGGCSASSTSPVGVNCNFSQEKPLRDMPLDCQGR